MFLIAHELTSYEVTRKALRRAAEIASNAGPRGDPEPLGISRSYCMYFDAEPLNLSCFDMPHTH